MDTTSGRERIYDDKFSKINKERKARGLDLEKISTLKFNQFENIKALLINT